MEDSMERLERLVRVEPPAELDRRVCEQLLAAVALERPSSERDAGPNRSGAEGSPPGLPLPMAERLVYAAGLLAYGSQALSTVARLLWRVVAG